MTIDDTRASTHVTSQLVRELRDAIAGDVLTPEDPGYEGARRVWNGIIDRRPGAIARCASASDVAAAVKIAERHRPVVTIRGGGHQVAAPPSATTGSSSICRS